MRVKRHGELATSSASLNISRHGTASDSEPSLLTVAAHRCDRCASRRMRVKARPRGGGRRMSSTLVVECGYPSAQTGPPSDAGERGAYCGPESDVWR